MGMMDLRRRVMMAGMFKEETATGNPMQFQTNLAKPLKSLVIPFTPVQSGSGDPSPSNVRSLVGWHGVKGYHGTPVAYSATTVSGYNSDVTISDKTDTSFHIVATGTNYLSSRQYMSDMNFVTGKTYTLTGHYKFISSEARIAIGYRKQNDSFVTGVNITLYNPSNTSEYPAEGDFSFTFTVTSEFNKLSVCGMASGACSYEGTFSNLYAYEGTPSSISCVFPAVGKNLFDKNAVTTGKIWYQGAFLNNSDNVASDYIPVEPGETYTINRVAIGQNTICYFDKNKTFLSQDSAGSGGKQRTIPEGAYYATFNVGNSYLDTAMYEKGSTASTYEPYTNTIYGGYVDIVTGVLTAEWCSVEAFDLTWVKTSQTANGVFRSSFPYRVAQGNDESFIICDKYKTIKPEKSISGDFQNNQIKGYNSSIPDYSKYVYLRDNRYTTLADFSANIDAFIVFKMYEPITYQLTPQQIQTLIGTNTIWSDTNGSNTAVYLKR